jgi:hypothetical protein
MFRPMERWVCADLGSTDDFCGDSGTSFKYSVKTKPMGQMAGLPVYYVNEVSSDSDSSSLLVRLNRTPFHIARYPHNGLGRSQCLEPQQKGADVE